MAFGLIKRKTAAGNSDVKIERSAASLRVGQIASLSFLDSDSGTSTLSLSTRITEISKPSLRVRTEYDPALRSGSPMASAIRSLRQGASLIVEVPDCDGLMRFHSILLELTSGHVFPGDRRISLTPPAFIARIQRRNSTRHLLHSPATFVVSPDLPPVHGTVCDLSETGFSAELGAPLGVYEADRLIALLPIDSFLNLRLPQMPDPIPARILTAKRIASRGGLAIRVQCVRLD